MLKNFKSAIFTLCVLSTSGFSEEVNLDTIKKFARGKDVISNIFSLQSLKLDRFAIKEGPWTSDYLPAIRGYAAFPYAKSVSSVSSFLKEGEKHAENFTKSIEDYQNGDLILDKKTIANLSPADKYDLLTGNFKHEKSYAAMLFNLSTSIREAFGSLTVWTGMCHGWAPAATAFNEPISTVKAISVDGQHEIPFYPNDIKALLSAAFANSTRAFVDEVDFRIMTKSGADTWNKSGIMPIVGAACLQKDPKVDENGRVLPNPNNGYAPKACNDVNPAFWHLTMLNLFARHKQALVVDIDHDEKINNHPTAGYEITYFNPKNGKKAKNFFAGLVPVSKFKKDIRAEHRSPNTFYIVGVKMKTNFVDYDFFNRFNARKSSIQKFKKRTFVYDLELDKEGNIIGGEWRNHRKNKSNTGAFLGDGKIVAGDKPDMVWYAPRGMKANANKEHLATGEWSIEEPLPLEWAEAAKEAALEKNLDTARPKVDGLFLLRHQPEVIFKIVHKLTELSQK